MLPALPVESVLSQLTAALRSSNCVVLRAPAGAGKTTRVPPALLNAGLAGTGSLVMLEPRRIAARTAARRMAFERAERVGQTIGYRVRFEESVSRETRILVVTEGILLRKLQDDPLLEEVGLVVFDEFHERRLDSDLALAMVRRVQQTVRPDLRIVVMSATLDPAAIARFLGDCPIVDSEGRLFPVRISYLPSPDRQPLPDLAVQGVDKVLQQTDGDVLVFLPGVGEILKTQSALEPAARRHNLEVMPLFGDLSPEEQDRVLSPCTRRKIVLSTNVAETSVTIDGVTAVVDTGFARQMQFDTDTGLDRLELTPISRAAADQRAGRAGRTQPGICLRLWDEASHRRRPDFETAELHRIDLSSAILRLFAWGEADVRSFPWFESPPIAFMDHAEKLLQLLGAVAEGKITALGRQLARLPVSPRMARLLLEARRFGQTDRASLMAAMLSERDPFLKGNTSIRGPAGSSVQTVSRHHSRSDVLDRLAAVEDFLKTGQTLSACGEIHRGAIRTMTQTARQLAAVVRGEPATLPTEAAEPEDALLRSLIAGFPDRVARRRESTGDKGLMVGGRGVRLGPRSAVHKAPLFLCVDIDGAGTDALVRQASEVRREWLPPGLLKTRDELFFHPTQKQVVARRRVAFDDLILEESPASIGDPAAAAEILFQAAENQIESVLPPPDDAFHGFLTRVRCLKQWMPELPLPDLSGPALTDMLRDLCTGRRSFAELRSAPWLSTVQSRLDYTLLQTLEREAPERIAVPSGNRIRLTYEEGRPPVLAVRIQEVFGLGQTPRIAGGRVAVLLHLLAPNMRPQQVTDDLASFWATTYEVVRKELKRRYPKHKWPEDPATLNSDSSP